VGTINILSQPFASGIPRSMILLTREVGGAKPPSQPRKKNVLALIRLHRIRSVLGIKKYNKGFMIDTSRDRDLFKAGN
jgi:hypothetical protein